ncbi:hypothetical protein GCM10023090_29340 [Acidovorax lacteus]|uniref:Uncharacterized protein n=1 Tax=Acidovorax lacteus TaxID=1924988 RepID=A0ABP8LHW5_9BURK
MLDIWTFEANIITTLAHSLYRVMRVPMQRRNLGRRQTGRLRPQAEPRTERTGALQPGGLARRDLVRHPLRRAHLPGPGCGASLLPPDPPLTAAHHFARPAPPTQGDCTDEKKAPDRNLALCIWGG